eukprot:TRINITY_DN2012_c0_g1_i4.p1 TRINITY_DN2012_c0_g1~~TRINITY_DN2012_c0_g1_i4.p1  ORF type:complete len:248 (-),score=17.55 TRINITY_DN2012_c0_g1_i4:238-981(-)
MRYFLTQSIHKYPALKNFKHLKPKAKSLRCFSTQNDISTIIIPTATLTGLTISGLRILLSGDRIGTMEEGDNIRWGVMGVVSCIPYMNWLSWIFGALDDENNKNLYFGFAFLYIFPYILEGLQLDQLIIFIIILNALHVQVERLAVTEPQQTLGSIEKFLGNVEGLRDLGTQLNLFVNRLKDGVMYSMKVREVQGEDSKVVENQLRSEVDLKTKKQFQQQEKELFDQQLQNKQREGQNSKGDDPTDQ